MEQTTFGKIRVGEWFRFDLGIENGLSCDLGKPGRRRYKKHSASTYRETGQPQQRIGSVKARVWRDATND